MIDLSDLEQNICAFIAVICYLACAIRILCFDKLHDQPCKARLLAVLLISSCFAQSLHIIFIKDPVTVWDAIIALFLAYFIFKNKGNLVLMRR